MVQPCNQPDAATEADPAGFVADLPERAILDEVQRVPAVFGAIKRVVDRRRSPGRFILTGSSNVLLPCPAVLRAVQRAGWVIVRQRGSHIRLRKHEEAGELLKLIVPAHNPIKRSTLAHILKDARLSVEVFTRLL